MVENINSSTVEARHKEWAEKYGEEVELTADYVGWRHKNPISELAELVGKKDA